MVYKSNLNEMAWDGKFLNIDLPNATYVYRIFDINGSVRQTGTVSIVR